MQEFLAYIKWQTKRRKYFIKFWLIGRKMKWRRTFMYTPLNIVTGETKNRWCNAKYSSKRCSWGFFNWWFKTRALFLTTPKSCKRYNWKFPSICDGILREICTTENDIDIIIGKKILLSSLLFRTKAKRSWSRGNPLHAKIGEIEKTQSL